MMINLFALPLALMLVQNQPCVSMKAFAESLHENNSGIKVEELLVLNGQDASKLLTDIGTPLQGVTNLLIFDRKDVTAFFVFVKGCYVGHVIGDAKKD